MQNLQSLLASSAINMKLLSVGEVLSLSGGRSKEVDPNYTRYFYQFAFFDRLCSYFESTVSTAHCHQTCFRCCVFPGESHGKI